METQSVHSAASNNRFASTLTINSKTRLKWKIIFVTFLSRFVLPNLILSHGIILVIRLENDVPIWNAILAPCIFSIIHTFSDPFFRDATESWASRMNTRSLCVFGIILTFTGLFLGSFLISSILYIICFGIFCGIGTCIALNQITYITDDVFYSDVNLIQIINNLGEAIGQLVFPFLISIIFNHYGSKMGHMILSAVILQILPAILLIKTEPLPKPIPLSQFGNYSRTFNAFNENETSFNGCQVSSEKTWKNPSDENTSDTVDDANSIIKLKGTENVMEHASTLEERYGLQILPKIPEVSEKSYSSSSDDEIDDKRNGQVIIKDSINRYSVISDKLDEIIEKDGNEITQIEKVTSERSTDVDKQTDSLNQKPRNRKTTKKLFSKSRVNSIMYRWHSFRRWFSNSLEYMQDTLIFPLMISLKIWKFYPSLLLNTCRIFVPIGVAIFLLFVENGNYFLSNTFLSIHALAWLCIFITSPWVMNISKSKYKYLTLYGFFTSAIGLFVLMKSNHIVWQMSGSFMVGNGHGIISLTTEETIKEYVGARRWSKIRDSLKRVTALFLIFLTIFMRYILENYHIREGFGFLACLQSISTLIFGILVFVKLRKKNPQTLYVY